MEYQIPAHLASLSARQVMKTTYLIKPIALHGVCSGCAHCGLTLTDAMSIETGLGPVCRKNSRFNDPENNETDETVAMALMSKYPEVFEFLLSNCGKDKNLLMKAMVRIASLNRNTQLHRDITDAIEALGWKTLAAHLRKPFSGLTISKSDHGYGLKIVKKYFNYEFWSMLKQHVHFNFDRANRVIHFKEEEKRKVWHLIKTYYPNFIVKTPDGYATVPGPALINNAVA